MTDSKLAETTKAVGKLFGTAAQLAQKQAALATLNSVTLPKLYHAIGKKIVGLEKLPPDLVPHREKIRALEAGINTKPEDLPAAPSEGFAAKAKHLAQQAVQKASKATADAAATMQIQAAYVGLGKEAVEKYGDKAIPKDLQPELIKIQQQRSLLESEVAAISGDNMRRVTLPTRLGWIAVALYGASWFLPASGAGLFSLSGWEAFRAGLNGGVLFKISALTNVIVCAGIALLFGWHKHSAPARRFLRVLLAASFLWNLPLLFGGVGVGYVAWMAAFVCLFFAIGEQSQLSPDAGDSLPVAIPSQGIFPLARAMAVAALSLVLVNTAVWLFTSKPSAKDQGDAPALASQPPPARESSAPEDKNARVDATQMFMNALMYAAAMRQAEEQRLLQQQAFQPVQPRQPVVPRDLSGGMAPAARPYGGAPSQPRFQQFEGTCTQCGYRTGRQVNQTQRKCSQLGVGVDPTRPCGGVIVWAPVQ